MHLNQTQRFIEKKYNLFSWGACIAFRNSLNDLDHPGTKTKSNAQVPWFSALTFHLQIWSHVINNGERFDMDFHCR